MKKAPEAMATIPAARPSRPSMTLMARHDHDPQDAEQRGEVGAEDDEAGEGDAEVEEADPEEVEDGRRQHLAGELGRGRHLDEVVDHPHDEHDRRPQQHPDGGRAAGEDGPVELGQHGGHPDGGHEGQPHGGPTDGRHGRVVHAALPRLDDGPEPDDQGPYGEGEQVGQDCGEAEQLGVADHQPPRPARSGYGVNLEQRVATSSRTSARTPPPEPSSPPPSARSRRTRAIMEAIWAISASPMPAVVTAAVPSRSPLVTNGERGSPGIWLRLQVMPAASRASWAALPVRSGAKVRRSTSNRDRKSTRL